MIREFNREKDGKQLKKWLLDWGYTEDGLPVHIPTKGWIKDDIFCLLYSHDKDDGFLHIGPIIRNPKAGDLQVGKAFVAMVEKLEKIKCHTSFCFTSYEYVTTLVKRK